MWPRHSVNTMTRTPNTLIRAATIQQGWIRVVAAMWKGCSGPGKNTKPNQLVAEGGAHPAQHAPAPSAPIVIISGALAQAKPKP